MPTDIKKIAEHLKVSEAGIFRIVEIPVFIEFDNNSVGFFIRFNVDEDTGDLTARPEATAMHYPRFPKKTPHNALIKDLERGSESQLRQDFVKKMKEIGFAGYLAYRTVNRINVSSTEMIRVNPDSDLVGIVNDAYQWLQEKY